jgi:NhaP-type Na+/H+ or K+/H+ antiporter
MNPYIVSLLLLGVLFFMASVLPQRLKKLPLSLPIVCVGFGALLPLIWRDMPRVDPVEQSVFFEHFAEIVVIISLMSVGLQLDRRVGWRSWGSTWRLLGITMPLCIAALALGGAWLLALPAAGAVLLGAVIAPTDPVLASDVQVGPPREGQEPEARFALTSEAGLNDGLAFPFVNLAVVLAASGWATSGLTEWVAVDVAWKIAAGLVAGATIGRAVGWFVLRWSSHNPISDGFMALALTLVAYGATELVNGYGFIGVFVAAVVFRRVERDHEAHTNLHGFIEQIERLVMVVMMVLFGAAISQGLLAPLTWQGIVLGLGFLFLVRPAAGLLGLWGHRAGWRERTVIAGFGIRGIGTFYYLAHGLNASEADEPVARTLWAVAGFIVLVSVVVHGMSADFVMRRFVR